MVEIGDQPGPCRAPSHLFLGLRARSRIIHRREMREPAEVLGRLFGRLADHRDIQAAPDHMFSTPHIRAVQTNWEGVARFAVAAFRADRARRGDKECSGNGGRAVPAEPGV